MEHEVWPTTTTVLPNMSQSQPRSPALFIRYGEM